MFTMTFQSMASKTESILTGKEAHLDVTGANMVRYKAFSTIPAFIHFRTNEEISYEGWESWMNARYFKGNDKHSFQLIGSEADQIGMVHYRYQQVSDGIPLEHQGRQGCQYEWKSF
jgi:Zn-dependent metalloprotease